MPTGLCAARGPRLVRLQRKDRNALHAVLGAGVAGPIRDELIGVLPDRLDPKARALDCVAVGVNLRGAADAGCPQVGIADGALLHLLLADDVGYSQAPPRLQYPSRLGEYGRLLRREVDHAV